MHRVHVHPLLVLAAFAVLAVTGLRAVELPATPAGHRLVQLTALTSDATPRRVAAFIESSYTPEYAARLPLERRIGSFMDWKARGGMRVVSVRDSQPHRVEVVAEHPLTGERMLLTIETTEASPHRIEGIYLGPAPLPELDESLSEREIAERWLGYVDGLAEAGLYSGAALIARDGKILGQRAWGLAHRDFGVPNDTTTRFNLGSLNKTWTAVAVAQLAESGKLSFDDPLSKFVDYPDAESAKKIRIEHLLTHTSGLGSYFTEEYDRTARKDLRSLDDFLALSADQPPAFEPGTDWLYSNTGMLVLGKVIEAASGQDYYDYIQQHILQPAGMQASGCFELDRVNEKLAVGYEDRWTIEGKETVNNLFEHVVRGGPAGGCWSTAGDLFRFAEALKAGRLVSAELAETVTTPKPGLGSPGYGYGFGIHPGGALYGHSGGFTGISANLDIVREPEGWVVVALANHGSVRPAVQRARHLIGVETAATPTP